jgi:hypothetical protein
MGCFYMLDVGGAGGGITRMHSGRLDRLDCDMTQGYRYLYWGTNGVRPLSTNLRCSDRMLEWRTKLPGRVVCICRSQIYIGHVHSRLLSPVVLPMPMPMPMLRNAERGSLRGRLPGVNLSLSLGFLNITHGIGRMSDVAHLPFTSRS